MKVSTQRTLNIANTAEITQLKAQPTFVPVTAADVTTPMLHAEIDKLTQELRLQMSQNAQCQIKIRDLESEIVGLKDDPPSAGHARTAYIPTDSTYDATPPTTPRTVTTDTVDSEKLRGLLVQLQHLVGPHFGGDMYFDID